MNKAIRSIIAFFILCWLLVGQIACSRESLVTVIDLPTLPKQPVMLAFLAPGDSIQVSMYWPVSLNESLTDAATSINNATLRITNTDTQESVVLPRWRTGVYSISQHQFAIIAGQSYRLSATIPGYEATLEATCRLPATASSILTTTVVDQINYPGFITQKLAINWQDVSDTCYYLIAQRNQTRNTGWQISTDPLYPFVTRGGGKVSMILATGTDKPGPYTIQLALITADKMTAEFYKQLDITQNFTSENISQTLLGYKGVLPELSNVSNGLGIVGTYLRTRHTLSLTTTL